MTDGSALLMAMSHSLDAQRQLSQERGTNLLDGGAHFYDVYETSDGKYISIGSIEPQFYALLVEKADLDVEEFRDQNDPRKWPQLKQKLEEVFKTRSRDEWCVLMEGTDVCFAPVLDIHEAPTLNRTTADTMKAGQIITVEPGIYLPDKLGVRLEDDVVITDKGTRVLTQACKHFQRLEDSEG
jgi:crotonobetainyl-CoA:carnitine CoA-transferase CaiB-like acyl-CoA transferase